MLYYPKTISFLFFKNMVNRLPLWIKEIIENDTNVSKFHLNEPGHFAIIKCKTSKIVHDGFIDKKSSNNLKVAFFRDGPFLPVSTGAVSSISGMISALVDKNVEVYLFYCYRGWTDYSLYKNQKFTTVFINPKDFYSNKKYISNILDLLGIKICHFDSAEAICIQKKLLPQNCKTIFEVHNVENELIKQFGASENEVNWIKRKEIKATKIADAIITRSQENYNSILKFGCNKNKLFIYRGGISVNDIKFSLRQKLNQNNILFLGHLNYKPNQQAVEIIATTIAPKIKNNVIIAGKGAPALKEKYQQKNIKFLGWIDDLDELFSKVDIALAPLISGSGTRLKVLDYMAAGIPVIGSSLSIEGLEPEIKENMIIEDDFEKYHQRINELYQNPKLSNLLSKNGRNFVEKYRNWEQCVSDVIKAYRFVLNLPNKDAKLRI